MGYTSGYFYTGNLISKEELYHHGILGMKWGIRRFQNPDGSLTEEGKKRYAYHPLTIKSELGYDKRRNGKINAAERMILNQYTEAKRNRNVWNRAAEKAQEKGKLERAKKYRDEGKKFAQEMLQYKKTANEYSKMSEEERKKINNWVIRNVALSATIGAATMLGTAAVSPVAVGFFPEQNMATLTSDYQRKHQK